MTLVVIVLVIASVIFTISSILNEGLPSVGPLLVRAGDSVAEKGSVTIVFLGDDFVLGGQEV